MKICTECKHYLNVYAECARKEEGINLHNGRRKYKCVIMERAWPNFLFWLCGKKGRFWEAG